MRLARGGSRDDSARMSLSSGGSPSTLAVPRRGRERRLAAKARAAAKESRADQRAVKAEMLGPREEAGTALERRRARSLTKVAASVLQRPPSLRARTTSLHRADCRNSGQVCSLALRASASAAPAVRPAYLQRAPAEVKGETV